MPAKGEKVTDFALRALCLVARIRINNHIDELGDDAHDARRHLVQFSRVKINRMFGQKMRRQKEKK